jgi:hypothetical protein
MLSMNQAVDDLPTSCSRMDLLKDVASLARKKVGADESRRRRSRMDPARLQARPRMTAVCVRAGEARE